MAELSNIRAGNFSQHDTTFTATSLSDIVDDTTSEAVIVLNGQDGLLAFELTNTGVALTDFAILFQPHEAAAFTVAISGATWGSVAGILEHVVGALNTLASGATAFAIVKCGPVYAVKFQAKVASSTTDVKVSGQAGRG